MPKRVFRTELRKCWIAGHDHGNIDVGDRAPPLYRNTHAHTFATGVWFVAGYPRLPRPAVPETTLAGSFCSTPCVCMYRASAAASSVLPCSSSLWHRLTIAKLVCIEWAVQGERRRLEHKCGDSAKRGMRTTRLAYTIASARKHQSQWQSISASVQLPKGVLTGRTERYRRLCDMTAGSRFIGHAP